MAEIVLLGVFSDTTRFSTAFQRRPRTIPYCRRAEIGARAGRQYLPRMRAGCMLERAWMCVAHAYSISLTYTMCVPLCMAEYTAHGGIT